jgi:hypothetical protein
MGQGRALPAQALFAISQRLKPYPDTNRESVSVVEHPLLGTLVTPEIARAQ